MYTKSGICTALLLITAIVVCVPVAAEEPLHGLVVDRGDNVLWLGFPSAVEKGMVFNVMLMPGNEVIARAEVLEATTDAPFIAKAGFKMLDKNAFIPVGAYVEATKVKTRETDRAPGFKAVTFGPKGVNPLSFQAGVFLPSGDQLQDETDQAWPALQLDYRLCKSQAAQWSVGVGYYGRRGTFVEGIESGGRFVRVVPVTIDVKLRAAEKKDKGWFAKLGGGAYIVHNDRRVGLVTERSDTTTIGWEAAFGYEARGRMAQLGYVDGRQQGFKGVTFTLGARF